MDLCGHVTTVYICNKFFHQIHLLCCCACMQGRECNKLVATLLSISRLFLDSGMNCHKNISVNDTSSDVAKDFFGQSF